MVRIHFPPGMSLRTSGPPAEGRCGAGSRRQVVGAGQIPRAQNTGSGSARSRNDGVQARDRARSFDQERRRDLRSDAGRLADDWAVSADRTYRVRCRDIAEHLAVGSAARISFPPHEHGCAFKRALSSVVAGKGSIRRAPSGAAIRRIRREADRSRQPSPAPLSSNFVAPAPEGR